MGEFVETFPEVLLEVELKVLSNDQCKDTKITTKNKITDQMLCAEGEGKDTCVGDSGGPLVTLQRESNSSYYLIGGLSQMTYSPI